VSSTASTWSPRSSRPSSARRRGTVAVSRSRDADPGRRRTRSTAWRDPEGCSASSGGGVRLAPSISTCGTAGLCVPPGHLRLLDYGTSRWPTSGLSTMPGCASAAALSRRECAVRSPDANTPALYGTRLLAELDRRRPSVGADVAAAALKLLGTPTGLSTSPRSAWPTWGCASGGWSGSWTPARAGLLPTCRPSVPGRGSAPCSPTGGWRAGLTLAPCSG